ncbi:hypothetical protein V1477_020109 [Vespula maculifrons]|uniref:Uncharacterized protein n=1 Tax=Vespula maculifrons TaxID=7453 RepID=A0ABD2AL01_VESMC
MDTFEEPNGLLLSPMYAESHSRRNESMETNSRVGRAETHINSARLGRILAIRTKITSLQQPAMQMWKPRRLTMQIGADRDQHNSMAIITRERSTSQCRCRYPCPQRCYKKKEEDPGSDFKATPPLSLVERYNDASGQQVPQWMSWPQNPLCTTSSTSSSLPPTPTPTLPTPPTPPTPLPLLPPFYCYNLTLLCI